MLRTALLFVRRAIRLVYGELPGPVAVCSPKQAHCELGDRVPWVAPASLSTVESSARGRDANTAYLYERIAEGDHEHAEQPDSPHVMRRGTSHDAAQLVRGIIATRGDRARTAHQVAASTDREGDLPDRVRSPSDRRAHAVQSRRTAYRHWHEETQELVAERQRWIDQHIGRDRSQDQGLDYGIDL